MEIVPYILEVDGQEVILTPDVQHEYLVTTEQVALGYGVGEEAIRSHKARRTDELLEGKHWVTVANSNGGAPITLWTKRGVVRLGFFIRSARARLFRDMAEDLMLNHLDAPSATGLITARLVAAAMGVRPKTAVMRLKRSGIQPTHHCHQPQFKTPGYLWPIQDVRAMWPEYAFTPFTGTAHPGLPSVKRLAPAQPPLFTSIEQLGAQLARQIVDDFVRDELPVRFRALMGRGVQA